MAQDVNLLVSMRCSANMQKYASTVLVHRDLMSQTQSTRLYALHASAAL